jgi:uncharacterized protein (TIGR03435 family)
MIGITLSLMAATAGGQTPPAPKYTYEVVSVHLSAPGQTNSRIGPGAQGGLRAQNVSVMNLLTFAYDVRGYQFPDAPSWVWSEHYDVSFTPDKEDGLPGDGAARSERDAFFNRTRQRMQAVLRDRFGLVLRAEQRIMPIYALTVAKGGAKLIAGDSTHFAEIEVHDTQMTATDSSIKGLADFLSGALDRPVADETALAGVYNFKLEWSPDTDSPDAAVKNNIAGGPSIFTAVTEQLGLRLESKRGPAPVYVIVKIEKPGQN